MLYVPSFTIDFIEIKIKIIRTIDQMLNSEPVWPVPEVYLSGDLDGVPFLLESLCQTSIYLKSLFQNLSSQILTLQIFNFLTFISQTSSFHRSHTHWKYLLLASCTAF